MLLLFVLFQTPDQYYGDVILQVPIHHFAEHCHRRLDRTMQSGAKRGVRKPTIDEIEQAKVGFQFHRVT